MHYQLHHLLGTVYSLFVTILNLPCAFLLVPDFYFLHIIQYDGQYGDRRTKRKQSLLRFQINQCFELSLTRLLRLVSLAHQATKLPFSLAQEQNLLAPGNRTWVFSCPDASSLNCVASIKFSARLLRVVNNQNIESGSQRQCFFTGSGWRVG